MFVDIILGYQRYLEEPNPRRGGGPNKTKSAFIPIKQYSRPKFLSWICNEKWLLGGFGVQTFKILLGRPVWSSIGGFIEILQNLYIWDHFEASNIGFLKKKAKNVLNFWQIFSRKIGSHKTLRDFPFSDNLVPRPPPPLKNVHLEMAKFGVIFFYC